MHRYFRSFCALQELWQQEHMNSNHDSTPFSKLFRSIGWGTGVLVLTAAVIIGCSSGEPKVYEVRGRVVFEGSPLPYGTVTFFGPQGNLGGVAEIDANGNYRLQVSPGKYTVGVYAHPGYENPSGSRFTKRGMPLERNPSQVPLYLRNTTTSRRHPLATR